MYIRGVFLYSLSQYCIDQLDDRCMIVTFQQVRWFWQILSQMCQIDVIFQPTYRFLCCILTRFILIAQGLIKLLRIHTLDDQRNIHQTPDFSNGRWQNIHPAKQVCLSFG